MREVFRRRFFRALKEDPERERGMWPDLVLIDGGRGQLSAAQAVFAEMAALAPRDFRRLVLVGAMGVKPPEGIIFDQAIVSYIDYARAGFHDQEAFAKNYGDVSTDQLVAWDLCREMSFRTAWKPYMYSQTLPHLLGGVRAPALVVWGDDDKIVPYSAGQLYARALREARLEMVRNAGHFVDMEQPEALARLVIPFIEQN